MNNELLVEVELDIADITGEPDAIGTSDAVVLRHDEQEIVVIDLKYGRGVKVIGDDNRQLMIYALAVLRIYELIADWLTVRIVIIQPRVAGGISEFVVTVEELRAFGDEVARAGTKALSLVGTNVAVEDLTPGVKQCKWCRAKPDCPAIRAQVLNEFADLDASELGDQPDVGVLLAKVELIEGWCKAIRTEAERRLFIGMEVQGYKLVAGKRGNRAWSSEANAIALFKAMRIKQADMYELKLISPTSADKLLSSKYPRRWAKAQALITQKEGSPTVVPVSDPRPAVAVGVDAATEFSPIQD
jgi:hypothetical protein